jgi:hypothetical protein
LTGRGAGGNDRAYEGYILRRLQDIDHLIDFSGHLCPDIFPRSPDIHLEEREFCDAAGEQTYGFCGSLTETTYSHIAGNKSLQDHQACEPRLRCVQMLSF